VLMPRWRRFWRRSVKVEVADAEGRSDGAAGLEHGRHPKHSY
jgi:hypothetical protein